MTSDEERERTKEREKRPTQHVRLLFSLSLSVLPISSYRKERKSSTVKVDDDGLTDIYFFFLFIKAFTERTLIFLDKWLCNKTIQRSEI